MNQLNQESLQIPIAIDILYNIFLFITLMMVEVIISQMLSSNDLKPIGRLFITIGIAIIRFFEAITILSLFGVI